MTGPWTYQDFTAATLAAARRHLHGRHSSHSTSTSRHSSHSTGNCRHHRHLPPAILLVVVVVVEISVEEVVIVAAVRLSEQRETDTKCHK